MRFLFSFGYTFSRTGYGGGHQIIRDLARELAQMGHAVHICCSGTDELGVVEADAPVQYHFSGRYLRRQKFFDIGMRTLRLATQLRPDYICCFTNEAGFVLPTCRAWGQPAFFYLAAPKLYPLPTAIWRSKPPFNALTRLLEFSTARSAARILTISPYASQLVHQHWQVEMDRIATVGTGVNRVFLEPVGAERRVAQPLVPDFISVGRINLQQKPLQHMAAAVASLSFPWHRWTIVGSGGLRSGDHDTKYLQKRINQLRLDQHVQFAGQLPSSDIVALLDAHPIALLPSTHESFFLTVYEAVARGCVVITNDVADIQRYFADTASVIIARDSTWLAYRDALSYAVAHYADLLPALPVAAQRVRTDYSWRAIAQRFLDAMER